MTRSASPDIKGLLLEVFMKAVVIAVCCFLFTAVGRAQSIEPTPIDPASLEGKQIGVLDADVANKLFDKLSTGASLVLANGLLQSEDDANTSGAAILCRFVPISVNQNGYISFFSDSKLEIKKIDKQAVPTLNLLQLTFDVHHQSFAAGYEHLDRQFTCFNQPGTIFSREALDTAFGSVFGIE